MATRARTATTTTTNLQEQLTNRAALQQTCLTQYTECMDNYCNVLDENMGRCACSKNITNYKKTSDALKESNTALQDVAQQIQYIGLNKVQIETLFAETEAEMAMSSGGDNTKLKNSLDKIKDMVIDIKTPSASSIQKSSTLDLSGLLDFSSDGTFGDIMSLFGGNDGDVASISNQRGATLYNTAAARCRKTVLDTCKAQGVDSALITNAYDMTIDKDCLAYESYLTEQNDEMLATIRNATNVLQRARLSVAANKNSYDLRGCIGALETCMTDEYMCGGDYEYCLDYEGKYIVAGEVVLGSTIGTFNEGKTKELLTDKMLDDPRDGKAFGPCAEPMNLCQDYTYVDGEFTETNRVIDEYLTRVIPQIKKRHDEVIAEFRSECISDVIECVNENNRYSTNDNISDSAVKSCASVITTCMSALGEQNPTNFSAQKSWVATLMDKKIIACTSSGGEWDEEKEECQCTDSDLAQSTDKIICINKQQLCESSHGTWSNNTCSCTGNYEPNEDNLTCKPVTPTPTPDDDNTPKTCSEGEYLEDTTCKTCEAGYACSNNLRTKCTDKTYSTGGATECTPCDHVVRTGETGLQTGCWCGTEYAEIVDNACKCNDENMTYNTVTKSCENTADSGTSTTCTSGQYLPAGATTCQECPGNYFHSNENATSKNDCYQYCSQVNIKDTLGIDPTNANIAGNYYYSETNEHYNTCKITSCNDGYEVASDGKSCTPKPTDNTSCNLGYYNDNDTCAECPDLTVSTGTITATTAINACETGDHSCTDENDTSVNSCGYTVSVQSDNMTWTDITCVYNNGSYTCNGNVNTLKCQDNSTPTIPEDNDWTQGLKNADLDTYISTANAQCPIVECDEGTYLPAGATDSSACTSCPKGYACPGGKLTPNQSNDVGKNQCTGNTYSDTTGATECTYCPRNKVKEYNETLNTICECDVLSYWDADQNQCKNCPTGFTYADENATSPDQCYKICNTTNMADLGFDTTLVIGVKGGIYADGTNTCEIYSCDSINTRIAPDGKSCICNEDRIYNETTGNCECDDAHYTTDTSEFARCIPLGATLSSAAQKQCHDSFETVLIGDLYYGDGTPETDYNFLCECPDGVIQKYADGDYRCVDETEAEQLCENPENSNGQFRDIYIIENINEYIIDSTRLRGRDVYECLCDSNNAGNGSIFDPTTGRCKCDEQNHFVQNNYDYYNCTCAEGYTYVYPEEDETTDTLIPGHCQEN